MHFNKRIILLFCLILLIPSFSRTKEYINYSLKTPASGLASNSVVDIIYDGENIWVGTGAGVSRSSNGGGSWVTFDHTNGLNQDGISALAYGQKDSAIWVATSYTRIFDGAPVPFGAGFNMTNRDSINWVSFQPEQASGVGKLAYDLAVSDTTVWAACFYGGLIRSRHRNDTLFWENVYIDSASKADYENGYYQDYRNRVFAVATEKVFPDTTLIWSGTAAGIFKFIYTTSDTADTVIAYQQNDTLQTISGNFVVALAVQKYGNKRVLWAGTQPTFAGYYAVSFTTDEGATWSQTLIYDKVWNFDFQDSVVWAATSSGLKKSIDLGGSWIVYDGMHDTTQPDQQILNPEFYAVRVVGDTVWAGGFDGLVKTTDNGNSWKVFRSFAPIGSAEAKSSYAYPNPFSPLLANRQVRIHYRPKSNGNVTIKIYDFEMKLVRTILPGVYKTADRDQDEPWDGKNEKGDFVANGIYFFKIEGPDGQEEWGKIGVLK